MKIERKKLIDILTKVQPGLASKEIIEQSHSFVFTHGRVCTYNDEIAVSTPIELEGIKGAVKAEEFYKLLNKSKAKEIELLTHKGELRLRTKRSKAGIRMESKISLPIDEITKPKKWIKLPKRFVDAIAFALFSVSTDVTKQILMCLHIEGRYVTACDNFRLLRYDMGKKAEKRFPKAILIPSGAATELVGYKPVEYARSRGWLHFRMEDGTVFSCRTYSQKYPDVSKLFKLKKLATIEMPKNMKSMLDRAGVFTKAQFEQDEQVRITIADNTLVVYAKGDAGWFKEERKIKYEGEEVKFKVNPIFLMKSLDLLTRVVIGNKRLKLEADNFVHLVYLLA